MSVDRRQAAGIAALARLRFDAEELERITGEMNQVLAHVEQLKSLAVDDMPGEGPDPLADEGDSTRGPAADLPDALHLDLPRMAPEAREGFFLVPPLPGVHAGESA